MSANIKVILSTSKLEVAAGETVEATIGIRNQSKVVDEFTIKIEGLDPTWWTLSVPSVSLFPGDQDEAKLTIRPPKEAEARAGSYPFQVKAVSQANSQEINVAEAYVILRGFIVWEADMSPTKVVGQSGVYRIELNNHGNADIDLNFKGKDPEENMNYQFDREKVTVPAGESAQVNLTVQPKKGEAKKQYNFQVLVKPADKKSSSGEVKALNGQLEYIIRRRFSWWILLLILGLLIAIFGMFLLVMAWPHDWDLALNLFILPGLAIVAIAVYKIRRRKFPWWILLVIPGLAIAFFGGWAIPFGLTIIAFSIWMTVRGLKRKPSPNIKSSKRSGS